MTQKPENKGLNLLIAGGMLVILLAGIREAQPILVPMLLSVFIALISMPALFWLESKKVPKLIAFILVGGAVIVTMLVIASIISISVSSFMNDLPAYKQKLEAMTHSALQLAQKYHLPIKSRTEIMKHINPSTIMGIAGNMLNNIGSLISNTLLIFLTVVFILFESSSLPAKLEKIAEMRGTKFTFSGKYLNVLKHYTEIKTLTSLATGVLVFVMLLIFKVDYPFLWAFLAFFLNYIPSIGSILAAIPAILLTLIQHGFTTAMLVAIGYLVINSIIGNVVEPKYMGSKLGLSPLVVFLSLVLWGWLLGPVGMFLSVPLTMAAKLILDSNEDTKWMGAILDP